MKTFVPAFGVQGSVMGWDDPWGKHLSDVTMRTGTGRIVPSQDTPPDASTFMEAIKRLGYAFYVHHLFPGGEDLAPLLQDATQFDIDVVLGNEYGNINGPWIAGTNRYDIPTDFIKQALQSGKLAGLLYDEPEHLQINAAQYRKDSWSPHFGNIEAISMEAAQQQYVTAIEQQVAAIHQATAPAELPVIAEHVFPTMFHAHARAGMTLAPKMMKESFQSLQLSTALGAAKQYKRQLWICSDLWGPDVGNWFIRTSGFPGHSPAEFAAALQLGYHFAPDRLFVENIDGILQHKNGQFHNTEFGDIWEQFRYEYVPQHPLAYHHSDATADIVLIHSDDSNYGQNERPFGIRELDMPTSSNSIFAAWHLISHEQIPAHGSCLHIPGYKFPRHALQKGTVQYPLEQGVSTDIYGEGIHPLFQAANNVLVFDGYVSKDIIGQPKLIILAGSYISSTTLQAVRQLAEAGCTVIACKHLLPVELQQEKQFASGGLWLPVEQLLSEQARAAAAPHLGKADQWKQRFGNYELLITPQDQQGFAVNIETINL
ncbi:hypothetical protein ACFSTH_11965 [Paenibacillus yanchengensis]|uniref:Transketolase n=1 Tax=Paenibacillus yanchengensis TaxID=2035833 RepID=A0ABW4YPI4_9BACL